MRVFVKWMLTGGILYLLSYFGWLIRVESVSSALVLSLVVALLHTLLKVASRLLVGAGCFTFGISIVPGIVLGIFAFPLALWKGQGFLKGVYIGSFLDAFVLAVILSFSLEMLQRVLLGKK